MALTTFTAAQVLTAAQMNAVQGNDYNQTVSTKTASYTLVAADKGTRVVMNVASANTVTVNTSLFSAGDTLVIQNIGAGVSTVTAGTATVSSAGPLAIPQYGSGTLYFTSAGVAIFFPSAGPTASSGLTLISRTTPTPATTLSFTNVFSSTYSNYLVLVSNISIASAANNDNVLIRFGTSGTPDTGSVYNWRGYEAQTTVFANNGTSQSSYYYNYYGTNSFDFAETFTIHSPNLVKQTQMMETGLQYSSILSTTGVTVLVDTTTQYTDLVFIQNQSKNLSGTFAFYGYANS